MSKEITIEDARIRNLIFKIINYAVEKGEKESFFSNEFDLKTIEEKFYFKKIDMKKYLETIFEEKDEKYKIKEAYKKNIKHYYNKYQEFRKSEDLKDLENEYREKFEKMQKLLTEDINKYKEVEKESMKILEKLHWLKLPLYKEYMIENRECIPEENIKEYYNHYHAMEDMYLHLNGDGVSWKSTEGDLNLNQDLKFEVYSERWGHYDRYNIKRTIDGWYVRFLSQEYHGKQKNGSDSIVQVLKHDSINIPDGFEDCLDFLWNDADSNEMKIDDLQEKMKNLSIWVSEVEKASKENRPKWYR